jgi:pimeloyl-ACP methyl ester carboxylesterase
MLRFPNKGHSYIWRPVRDLRSELKSFPSELGGIRRAEYSERDASAAILSPQMKHVATDVKVIELKGSGHWLMEERPQETMDALVEFL